MSLCELTGKGPVVKNLVSHSNIKTKSRALPNIQKKRIFSKSLNQMVCFRLATSTLRTIEHKGGFDNFILTQPDQFLSQRARVVKRRLKLKLEKKQKNS